MNAQSRNPRMEMKNDSHGFTRIEATFLIAALALLGATATPLLGTVRGNSERASCANNLRQIGYAVRLWGNARDDLPPWLTPMSAGGQRPDTSLGVATAWVNFLSLSNELATPRVLACPSDQSGKVASGWTTAATGLANSGLRANAVSYLIGLHNFPDKPRGIISADRHVRVTTSPVSCGPGFLNNAASLRIDFGDQTVAWTNALHGPEGHILFNDGAVDFVSSEGLRAAVPEGSSPFSDSVNLHILPPR